VALFLSTYTNKIDRKGRLSVPAPFRASLTEQDFKGVVAFRSWKHPALDCFGMDTMQSLGASLNALDLFSDTQDDLAAAIFADARPLAFDNEGRILLPEDLVAHANLTEQACLVGRGQTFQIWEPQAFAAYQTEARSRVKSAGLTLKLTGGVA
jgi:MraZ protein